MTTRNQAREAMYLVFKTAWEADANTTAVPYEFDNEDFDPADLDEWARFTVRHTGGGQETLGKNGCRKFGRTGSIFIQTFTALDAGVDGSDVLTTVAHNAFEGVQFPGTTIRIYDVVSREVGPGKEWFEAVVEAQFEYDETR